MRNIQLAIIGLLLCVIVVMGVLISKELTQEGKVEKAEEEMAVVQQKPEKPAEPVVSNASIAMIGDILLHKGLTRYSDYTSSFGPMQEHFQSYDFLMANQESLPVGNKFELIGYPRFSSPDFLLGDLKTVGVDLVNIANNHTVDKGEEGVKTLFENLARYDMPYVGAYQSQEDAATNRIIELNGIKVGLLSYTYGTNGLYLPDDSPYVINYIDDAKIQTDIATLKQKVDVTAVIMHWGPEFTTQESEEQRRLAALINTAGGDIIFGMHPHVLQRYDKLVHVSGQETHVFYSLGNYFSLTTGEMDSMIGGVASVNIKKVDDEVTIHSPTLTATSMLKDKDGIYRVYPLAGNEARSVRDLAWVKQVIGDGANVQ